MYGWVDFKLKFDEFAIVTKNQPEVSDGAQCLLRHSRKRDKLSYKVYHIVLIDRNNIHASCDFNGFKYTHVRNISLSYTCRQRKTFIF